MSDARNPLPTVENDADCACGRGPGHIRIKAAGCNPDTRRHARGCAAAVAPSARCTCPIPSDGKRS